MTLGVNDPTEVVQQGFKMHTALESAKQTAQRTLIDQASALDKLEGGPEQRSYERQSKLNAQTEAAANKRHAESLAVTREHNQMMEKHYAASEARANAQLEETRSWHKSLEQQRAANQERMKDAQISEEENRARTRFDSATRSIQRGISSKKGVPDEMMDSWANSAIQLQSFDPKFKATTPITDSKWWRPGMFDSSLEITPEEWVMLREARQQNPDLTNGQAIERIKALRAQQVK